jgi:DNA-directed RNA polymerase subunit RPC12/RpoP
MLDKGRLRAFDLRRRGWGVFLRGIRIDLPKRVYVAGEEVTGIAYVSLDKPVSQRSATICLIGKERTEVTYSAGESSNTAVEESEFLHREFPLHLPIDEKGKLTPGDYGIPFRFIIPQGLPATYRGRNAKILYAITARIDVPRGFDIKDSYQFVVTSGSQTFMPSPTYACSDSWNNPSDAGIDFTLERCVYGIGEALSGRCAFRNPHSKNIRKIVVALKWIETAKAQGHGAKTKVMGQINQLQVKSRAVKGESPFSIRIPRDAPQTYESSLSSVRCILTVNLDIALGYDIKADGTIRVIGSPEGRSIIPSYPEFRQSDIAKIPTEKPYQPDYSNRREYLAETRQRPTARCTNCGATPKTKDASYCPYCGSRMPIEPREIAPPTRGVHVEVRNSGSPKAQGTETCTVCGRVLNHRDDVVWCPYCGKLAHREHLLQWIASNRSCPACGNILGEKDYR